MEQFVLIMHVIISVLLIALVLSQQGKGAEVGAFLVVALRKLSLAVKVLVIF